MAETSCKHTLSAIRQSCREWPLKLITKWEGTEDHFKFVSDTRFKDDTCVCRYNHTLRPPIHLWLLVHHTHTHTHYVGCPRGVEYIPHSICNAHCSVPQWYSSARLRTTWVPILAPIPCNNNYLPLSSSSTLSLSSNSSRKWFPGTWEAHTWSFCVGCRRWRVEWHKQSGEIPWWTHRLEPNDSVTSRRE